jgi:hypothetical protein
MANSTWLTAFQAAQEESDVSKLHTRVVDAEYAILERMRELRPFDKTEDAVRAEYHEMHAAPGALLRIKTDNLKWPATGLQSLLGD